MKMSAFIKSHGCCLGRTSRIGVCINTYTLRRNSTNNVIVKSGDGVSLETQEEYITQERELDIEKLRDKSRLKSQHRNVCFNKKPFTEPLIKAHLTVQYNRKMYGRYGSESGVYPGIMWPTKLEIEERKEFEKIAYPHTVQELIALAKKEEELKELKIQQRHDKVVSNLSKLNMWKKELKEKLAKKEADALAVKEKKERLIEEVRRHFGFKVNPHDEKFKDMLAIKEKEQKKKEKQARIEGREQKAVAKLMASVDS